MDFPVFIRRGDALDEIRLALASLRGAGDASDVELGLHKTMYVARADQTVVMVTDATSPLAEALRSSGRWQEPKDG
jgi:hypothetical protein